MGLFKRAKHGWSNRHSGVEYTALAVKKPTPENIARTLEHSAKMFDVFGWVQGTECDETGKVCAIGAIAAALGYTHYNGPARSSVLLSDQGDLAQATYAAVSAVTKTGDIVCMNDDTRKGVQSVKARFEKAAQEVRDGTLVVDTSVLDRVSAVKVTRNGRTRRLFN